MPWDVIGQEWAAELLQQQIQRGELRHAYLFTGPPGVGRRTLALRFTQSLNCPQAQKQGVPCLACPTCKKIERMAYPDLTVVQAVDEEGNPQIGGRIKVDQVRSLQQTLSLSPFAAQYRVALLLRFEEANQNAQNALLKTLEEAPSRAILLLNADEAESLLPTIVSRCEVLRLRPMSSEVLSSELKQRWDLPEEEANHLAHLSGGRVGRALQLHQQPELLEERRVWLDELMQNLAASRRERFAYAERVTGSGDKRGRREKLNLLRSMLQVWLSLWRDVFICASGADQQAVNLDLKDEIQKLANEVGPSTARACTADLERSLSQLSANINPRLLMEVLLLDMPYTEGECLN